MARFRTIAALCFISLSLLSVARADIVFELKNDPQPDEQNIQFNKDQVGMMVVGFTNVTNNEVDFSSSVNTLMVTGNGQAQVTNANGGNLNDIFITTPGATFQDFIVDLNSAKGSVIDITVYANDGPHTFEFTGTSGSNFVTIFADNGESITGIEYMSTAGWQVFKQPRISGVHAAVPEPGSLLLLGTGVVGLAGAVRRRLAG